MQDLFDNIVFWRKPRKSFLELDDIKSKVDMIIIFITWSKTPNIETASLPWNLQHFAKAFSNLSFLTEVKKNIFQVEWIETKVERSFSFESWTTLSILYLKHQSSHIRHENYKIMIQARFGERLANYSNENSNSNICVFMYNLCGGIRSWN